MSTAVRRADKKLAFVLGGEIPNMAIPVTKLLAVAIVANNTLPLQGSVSIMGWRRKVTIQAREKIGYSEAKCKATDNMVNQLELMPKEWQEHPIPRPRPAR